MTYADTLQHIKLISAKREALVAKQLEAEAQLIHAVSREWRNGNLTLLELADVYEEYRQTSDPGYSKRWNEAAPVLADALLRVRKDVSSRYAPEPETGWYGIFPLGELSARPRPGVCVVYVLFDGNNVPCYVGSTNNLAARMKAHHKDGKRFGKWQARSCSSRADAYALERRWLAQYMPYLNKRSA